MDNVRQPDKVVKMRLIDEYDSYYGEYDEEKIVEEVKRKSMDDEKNKRREMCKNIVCFLDRTKKYVKEDEILQNFLIDFCECDNLVSQEVTEIIMPKLSEYVKRKKITNEIFVYIIKSLGISDDNKL